MAPPRERTLACSARISPAADDKQCREGEGWFPAKARHGIRSRSVGAPRTQARARRVPADLPRLRTRKPATDLRGLSATESPDHRFAAPQGAAFSFQSSMT